MTSSNSRLLRRKNRVRNKIRKVSLLPRLSVFVSGLHTYAQIIDDSKSATVVHVATVQKDFSKLKIKCNVAAAREIGLKVGEVALKQGITKVVFDKGAKDYHGRVEALANGAREAGLQF